MARGTSEPTSSNNTTSTRVSIRPLLDLKSYDPTLPQDVYTHSVFSSAGGTERLVVKYGGASQDLDDRVVIFDKNNPANRKVINTANSTLDGSPTNIPLGFTMHAAFIDLSGEYIVI